MRKHGALVWCAVFVGALNSSTFCQASIGNKSDASTSRLVTMAAAQFPNLTNAERALLVFVNLRNRAPGDFAAAGPSAVPTDPSNNPALANNWGHEREVRADLIRWLCADPDASAMVDRRGIRLLGARVTGSLDLSHVKVPFGLVLVRCSIAEKMNLDSTELAILDLNASYIGEIYGPNLKVEGDADIGWDGHDYGNKLQASGEVDLEAAQIGGAGGLTLGFARFHTSPSELAVGHPGPNAALFLAEVSVRGGVYLCCGAEYDGAVVLDSAKIGGMLFCSAGHFINPGQVALSALSASIDGDVYLTHLDGYGDFVADGLVDFSAARVNGLFWVDRAKFLGSAGTPHGLNLSAATIDKVLGWQHAELQNGATLSLNGAKVANLADDEQSWPQPGNLTLDGFVYDALAPPNDASSRLRWLRLQPPGFHVQPYRQLAKYLSESGDDVGATRVLIAQEDARYANSDLAGATAATILKWTIGYGHRPLLAIWWSLAIVLLGCGVVRMGMRAGVMRRTYPENAPSNEDSYEPLHPLLYSLDVFVPFVNLHQEHYWWPDSDSSGEFVLAGIRLKLRGSTVRAYLWLQIIAGWLLSAIFIAGVTGLIRNE